MASCAVGKTSFTAWAMMWVLLCRYTSCPSGDSKVIGASEASPVKTVLKSVRTPLSLTAKTSRLAAPPEPLSASAAVHPTGTIRDVPSGSVT